MLGIAIVEDDREQAALLETHIKRYAAEHQLVVSVSVFYDAVTFLEKYTQGYQMIFMDIKMPMLDGMDAARFLRERDQKVVLVFVTTMRQYAIQGYDVDAADFIVKPVNYPEFALKFTRLLGKVERPEAVSPDVFIKTENSFVRLAPSDIFYVEGKGHYCVYHTASGEYRRYQALKNAEASLSSRSFARCNNFLLVNLEHVSKIDGMSVFVEGEELQISHPKRKAFVEAFSQFMERL